MQNWIDEGVGKQILNSKEAQYIVLHAPKVPVMYTVPKIHKNKEMPPGRPIISEINSLFSRLGEYLDGFFKPLVSQSPSYLKDSKDLIVSIQHLKATESTIMATIDIESLYTSICHKDALETLKWALCRDSKPQKI